MILSSKELAEIVEAVLRALDKHGLTESQEIAVKEIARKVVWRWMGKTFLSIRMARMARWSERLKP